MHVSGKQARLVCVDWNTGLFGSKDAARIYFARILSFFLMALLFLTSAAANAQTTTYTNTSAGAINSATACPTSLSRTFSVGSGITVADVNIGIYATHSWRGDLRFTLVSPSGTRVQIVNNPGGANNDADNFNVLLDDEATGGAVSTYTSTAGTSAPPYTVSLTPQALLSAFDGQNAAGNWTLEICDTWSQSDTGNFVRADLYITQAGPQADLSVTKTVSSASPTSGSSISYTVTVTNAAASTLTATGVSIKDVLPNGLIFTSASSANGSYSPSTGLWTLSSGLAPGSSATLTINATVTASQAAVVTNWAEVWTSSANDSDSTPGNDSTTEDDDASASFTVGGTRVAGTPPSLSCPVGSSLFDWDTKSWGTGSTSNSYPQTGFGQIAWNLNITGGVWGNVAALGGQNPALQNNGNTGGLSPVQYSLSEYTDFSSRSGTATTVIGFDTPIPGVQFRMFDVDYSAGAYADMVTVTGSVNGSSVTPVLTNGISNWVSGNMVVGDGQSANTSADGTVWVTFPTPVDQITITYGNYSTAPTDPGTQAIAIHDLTLCNPQAGVKMTKSSANYNDGVNPLFNLPQTDVLYTLNITNDKSASLSNNSVFIVDPLPSQVTFYNGDADGSGPGTTPVIFTDNGSGLTFNYATDVRYSNAAVAPTSFAACTYTPSIGYDANVKHICINPKGTMLGQTSTSTPGFTVTFRTRIN